MGSVPSGHLDTVVYTSFRSVSAETPSSLTYTPPVNPHSSSLPITTPSRTASHAHSEDVVEMTQMYTRLSVTNILIPFPDCKHAYHMLLDPHMFARERTSLRTQDIVTADWREAGRDSRSLIYGVGQLIRLEGLGVDGSVKSEDRYAWTNVACDYETSSKMLVLGTPSCCLGWMEGTRENRGPDGVLINISSKNGMATTIRC